MFDFISDLAKGIGTITGSVIGLSVSVIANTLGVSIDVVNKALEAGCASYEDI